MTYCCPLGGLKTSDEPAAMTTWEAPEEFSLMSPLQLSVMELMPSPIVKVLPVTLESNWIAAVPPVLGLVPIVVVVSTVTLCEMSETDSPVPGARACPDQVLAADQLPSCRVLQ